MYKYYKMIVLYTITYQVYMYICVHICTRAKICTYARMYAYAVCMCLKNNVRFRDNIDTQKK